MKVHFPNSAHLQNLGAFINQMVLSEPDQLAFSMHESWISVHPVVLSMTACLAALVKHRGGATQGQVNQIRALAYPIRMGLFRFLELDPGRTITAHEESGRFVPLTQIHTSAQLREAITNLVPLLHAPKEVADSIRYVFSEMVRNVIEHAASPVGAFVCAQYYKNTNRISIGIADAGVGILATISRSHAAHTSREAITLALQPGVTGATSRIGGNEFNAGAGLFFTKSIAALSKNLFVLYSGDAMFKLLRGSEKEPPSLHADPKLDNHRFVEGLPAWPGTVVGIDINIDQGGDFPQLLDSIRKAYSLDVKRRRKAYYKAIKFVK